MVYKNYVFITFLSFCALISAQTKNNEWQIGVGASITRFNDEYATFVINDKHQIQVPRFNIAFPLNDNFSFDTAVSVNSFDFEFIDNNAFYFSTDLSVRYHVKTSEWFYPYAFGGFSIVNSDYSIAPAVNFGGGFIIWFNNLFGINFQTYFKNPFENAEFSSTHLQFTGGLVFAIDPFDLLIFGRTGKVCY